MHAFRHWNGTNLLGKMILAETCEGNDFLNFGNSEKFWKNTLLSQIRNVISSKMKKASLASSPPHGLKVSAST